MTATQTTPNAGNSVSNQRPTRATPICISRGLNHPPHGPSCGRTTGTADPRTTSTALAATTPCPSRARARLGLYVRSWQRSCRQNRARQAALFHQENLWQTIAGCALLCASFLAFCWIL